MERLAIRDILDLVFPRYCAGCGSWDTELCPECGKLFSGPWKEVAAPYLQQVSLASEQKARSDSETTELVSAFPIYALSIYSGRCKKIIVEWKHANLRELDKKILYMWKRAVEDAQIYSLFLERITPPQILPSLGLPEQVLPSRPEKRVLITNAPSAASRRRAGQLVAAKLAKQLALSWGYDYAEVLQKKEQTLEGKIFSWQQNIFRSLTGKYVVKSKDRRLRAANAIKCNRCLEGYEVFLVDDVVTTGSTLRSCRRAIEIQGGEVRGALALAAVKKSVSHLTIFT